MSLLKYPEGEIWYSIISGKDAVDSGLPLLVFIHAAIADHTMWDEQIEYLSTKGFPCIQYDMLGFGASMPSQEYLNAKNKQDIDHIKHISDLIEAFQRQESTCKVVLIGLSMGGAFAIRFAVLYPQLISGVVVAAGSVPGFDAGEFNPKELDMDADIESAIENGNTKEAAELQVHYWGDGPLQTSGRCPQIVRDKLYQWCLDIAKRQHVGSGGFALPVLRRPEISYQTLAELNVPFAIAIGKFDETATNAAMKHLKAMVVDSDLRQFEAAHMINLECPEEFNDWVYSWLKRNFDAA